MRWVDGCLEGQHIWVDDHFGSPVTVLDVVGHVRALADGNRKCDVTSDFVDGQRGADCQVRDWLLVGVVNRCGKISTRCYYILCEILGTTTKYITHIKLLTLLRDLGKLNFIHYTH